MSEREPSMTPESYVTDKARAARMAGFEDDLQVLLSQKIRNENSSPMSIDEIKDKIEKSGVQASSLHDEWEKGMAQAQRMSAYMEEHPRAVPVLDKAMNMAEAESSAQEALSRKLKGEDIITPPSPGWDEEPKNWSEDELRKNIEDRATDADIQYDMEWQPHKIIDLLKAKAQPIAEAENEGIKSDEKSIKTEDYVEEHPDAIVDPSEAMVMAEATKSREEEISALKQEAYKAIEKGSLPPILAESIKEKREQADVAANAASEIYKM